MNRILYSVALTLMLLSAPAQAGVQEFTDKDEWIDAVGKFTTIDFTGFPEGTFITDQYADVGVLFTDGNDTINVSDVYLNDGSGLRGSGIITLAFDLPQAYIAVDFPGFLTIDLYSRGELIYASRMFGVGGAGNFGGLLSSQLFDAAVLSDPADGFVFIDDLHFGVPAPGTLTLLALGA